MADDDEVKVAGARPRMEALVGVAVAGLILGSVTAVVAAGASESTAKPGAGANGSTTSAQPAPHESREDPLRPLVDALAEAHAELREEAGDADVGSTTLPPTLRAAIRDHEWLPELRLAMHEKLGPGALMARDGLTAPGRALVGRLADVAAHGLEPKRYGLPELATDVETFEASLAGATITPPVEAGPAGAVLLDVLRGARFDRSAATVRLREAGGSPTPDHVEELAEALAARRESPETAAEAATLDERLGRALLRLTLDFEFVNVTGPFEVTRRLDKHTAKKSVRRKVLARIDELVQAPDAEAGLASLDPPHPFYGEMRKALVYYRELAASGCHSTMPDKWKVRPGDKGDRVVAVQKRLTCEGYYDGPLDGDYGESMLGAVADYQRHHELNPEGYVFKETIRSMNVPLTRRVEQIELALQRMRESKVRQFGDYYIRVNLPAFELQIVDHGVVLARHKVIVGTNRLDDDKGKLIQGHINRTRLFTTRLYEVIANPDWILPKRVEVGEIKTKMAEDPGYLEKMNIAKKTLEGGHVVYIQRRGKGNVLGKVKFLLEESQAIYLHDTDKRSLFRELRRDFSHGCVRVHRPITLAQFLLERDGWDAKEVKRSLDADHVQRGMKLRDPVPLVIEYVTVDIAEDGAPTFLTDIYGFDKAYRAGKVPPQVTARWGSPILRPSWVPRVPEEVVEDWRARGKSAPHDYDPTKHGVAN